MVEEALLDHAYIDENRVPEGFLKHTLSDSIRQTFVSHLLRCEECRDRVLLAEMFLNEDEAAQPVPPVQVVQVPDEPEPEPADAQPTVEIPVPELPALPEVPEPVELTQKVETLAPAQKAEAPAAEPARMHSVVSTPARQERVRPEALPKQSDHGERWSRPVVSYIPKERLLSGLESWQIKWLLLVGAMLLAVFTAAVVVISYFHH